MDALLNLHSNRGVALSAPPPILHHLPQQPQPSASVVTSTPVVASASNEVTEVGNTAAVTLPQSTRAVVPDVIAEEKQEGPNLSVGNDSSQQQQPQQQQQTQQQRPETLPLDVEMFSAVLNEDTDGTAFEKLMDVIDSGKSGNQSIKINLVNSSERPIWAPTHSYTKVDDIETCQRKIGNFNCCRYRSTAGDV